MTAALPALLDCRGIMAELRLDEDEAAAFMARLPSLTIGGNPDRYVYKTDALRVAAGLPLAKPRQPRPARTEATVYVASDASTGEVLYVGITSRGLRRVHSHAKGSQWWYRADSLELHHCPTRELAERLEKRLIRELSPSFNITYNMATA